MNKATCIITNCRGRAPSDEPFCAKHRDTPKARPTASDGEAREGETIRRAIRSWVAEQDDSDADISPLQYVLNREDTLADAILAALPTADKVEPVAWRTEYRGGGNTRWRYCYHDTEPHPAPLSNGAGHKNVQPLYATPPTTDASERMREAES